MIGLRSQFGEALLLAMVVLAMALTAGLVAARREHLLGRPWLPPLARALGVGAVIATIVSTALPRRFAIETDGDLALRLGSGGLRDWRVLLDDPLSLAAIEMVGNVVLYTGAAFAMFFGWYRKRRYVLPVCLALSVVVESVQYLFLGRVAALDDVLLNMAGAVIGYAAAAGLVRFGIVEGDST